MPNFTLADFRKDLSPKYKLVPKLDKAIADFDEEWEFKYEPKVSDLYWHPSSNCFPHALDLYRYAQDRLNPDPVEEADHKRRMSKFGPVGHFWHQFLQTIMVRYDMCDPSAIEREGFKGIYEPAIAWSDNPGDFLACRGSADVAPWNFRGYDYIVDFKTMGSRSFQAPTLPVGFAAKYECQMNIYMDFFGCDRALIVAINKDTPHDFKEFEFRRNQPLIDMIYEKWRFVADCLKDGEPPEVDDEFELPLEWV